MKWLISRLSEPSTHAAITGALAIGMQFVPPPWNNVLAAIAAATGFAGVAVSEKKSS